MPACQTGRLRELLTAWLRGSYHAHATESGHPPVTCGIILMAAGADALAGKDVSILFVLTGCKHQRPNNKRVCWRGAHCHGHLCRSWKRQEEAAYAVSGTELASNHPSAPRCCHQHVHWYLWSLQRAVLGLLVKK